ncbi:MAG: hypothetical protein ACP5RI_01655 [Candidatus Micrarchaeia archaeon]
MCYRNFGIGVVDKTPIANLQRSLEDNSNGIYNKGIYENNNENGGQNTQI